MLFEIARIPYSPPSHMLTLLGEEKPWVFAFMVVIAAGWSLYVLSDGLHPLPAAREVLAFAALLSVLAAAGAAVVCYPLWPVTPLDLLCK
ncbi:MAG: hypothetical protein ACRC33_05845 [Gemmataceae bacterium]